MFGQDQQATPSLSQLQLKLSMPGVPIVYHVRKNDVRKDLLRKMNDAKVLIESGRMYSGISALEDALAEAKKRLR